MEFQNLLCQAEGGIATLTLNRPEKLNALNQAILADLDKAFHAIESDPQVLVVVLTGVGEKAFAAGADIGELAGLGAAQGKEVAQKGQDLFARIERFRKPVIAAVNGFALGAGCELAMACHIRIASEAAQFGQPEINLGLIPGYGGTQRLARLVGRGIALELLLTGDRIGAARAHELGLVNMVVPAEKLAETARGLAEKIAAKAPVAASYLIQAVGLGCEMSLPEACQLEATLFGLCCSTQDMKEGTAAFLEKRKAKFAGR